MAIPLQPYGKKFQVQTEPAGSEKYWSQTTTYEDVLFAHGQHVQTYADISHLAKGLAFAKLGITESTVLSPLFEYVTGEGGIEVITENSARWRIYSEPDRRAMSMGNINDSSNEYLGLAHGRFKLYTDVDWYKESDVLSPVRNKRIQVRVVSEKAVPVDGGYQYTVDLVDENDAAFLGLEYLNAGEYWIKMGGITSWEKAGTASSLQFGESFAYVEWGIPLTTMMWEFEVEGEAHRKWGDLKITRCADDGSPVPGASKITNYLEARANAQVEQEKEFWLTYGTKSEHLIDNNTGKQITTGPGLFEFLEEGNVMDYDPEANGIDFIIDQIESVWFDRVPKANRELLLLTGQAGLKIWSEWVNEKFGETAATFQWDFVLQRRVPFDNRGGRNGFAFAPPQFTEYLLPTFGSVKIAHWDILDNTRINAVQYPGSIYPVHSYEFVAFNIGFGEPNVKFLVREDNRISTYACGLWSPAGVVNSNNPVWKNPNLELGEAYKWIHRETFGVALMDASSTLFFKPNVTY